MITAVIFSRDRPMQLDLLLRSLKQKAPGVFRTIVIDRATTDATAMAYERCRSDHLDTPFHVEDRHGNTLPRQAAALLDGDLSCFLTDDSVLYRGLPEVPVLDTGVLCFSLRLGVNTNWCYPHDREQQIPPFTLAPPAMFWKWRTADGDFGYPGSLDGHIFRTETLRQALADAPAGNPNRIEEHLMTRFSDSLPLMGAFQQSCLLGIPVNRVNETNPNRNGTIHGYSVQDLNRRYLRGDRIDLNALDFSDVRGAHQEIPLVFQ